MLLPVEPNVQAPSMGTEAAHAWLKPTGTSRGCREAAALHHGPAQGIVTSTVTSQLHKDPVPAR